MKLFYRKPFQKTICNMILLSLWCDLSFSSVT